MTLPVILALAAANPSERETIVGALGHADAPESMQRAVTTILERHGALERTLEQAEDHARLAREALRTLPPSELRTLLGDIAGFTVSRAY
jgi:octaprenyl-diphosphate synthase